MNADRFNHKEIKEKISMIIRADPWLNNYISSVQAVTIQPQIHADERR